VATDNSITHTYTHTHTIGRNSEEGGRRIGPSQERQPENTQYSLKTNSHGLGGIRIRNPRKRAAANLHLREMVICCINFISRS